MNLKLSGDWVLVTGSSGGIGLGIAEAFLGEGANIILTGRERTNLLAAARNLESRFATSKVLTFCGDLGKSEVLHELAAFIRNEVGFLDHLVCNIGSGKSVPLLEENAEEFQRVLDINLLTAVSAVSHFRELLSPQGEHATNRSITFISSICGLEALGCPAAYSSAKSALASYAGNIARPLGKAGIRVNVVSPGNILFPGSTWEQKLAENPESIDSMLDQQVPLARFGSIAEIGSTVVFLASRQAGFITGANIVVDGGQTRNLL